MFFLLRKQFFEKIITEGGRELIVLNPFLDSLYNFGLKNIGLTPGTGSRCFQSSQDTVGCNRLFIEVPIVIVIYLYLKKW